MLKTNLTHNFDIIYVIWEVIVFLFYFIFILFIYLFYFFLSMKAR